MTGAAANGDQWKADPDGGFIRIPKKEPEIPVDPLKDPLYGWKPDPSGPGYVRMAPDEMPPIPRAGGPWCKITGLKQNADWNGRIVECSETADAEDGTVEIKFDGKEQYKINAYNIVPLPGSEKTGAYHKEISLKVNGINCKHCKESLLEALTKVKGVDEAAVTIKTKEQTKVHPNAVVIKGAVDEAEVKAAIATLDNKRNKYTIV